ncbi:MAG: hypothetical protein LBS81_04625 [Endomicrobium sp.]|nr:hypothetical protein [Endomicrobium sp.]
MPTTNCDILSRDGLFLTVIVAEGHMRTMMQFARNRFGLCDEFPVLPG